MAAIEVINVMSIFNNYNLENLLVEWFKFSLHLVTSCVYGEHRCN